MSPCRSDPGSGNAPLRYIIPTAQRVYAGSWIRAATSSLAEDEMNRGYADAASASRSAPTAIETKSPGYRSRTSGAFDHSGSASISVPRFRLRAPAIGLPCLVVNRFYA